MVRLTLITAGSKTHEGRLIQQQRVQYGTCCVVDTDQELLAKKTH